MAYLNIEAAHIDVSYPTIENVVSYPLDADIIVIVGFFESTSATGKLLPVSSLEHGLSVCSGIDEFNRLTSNTAKALVSCWDSGGRFVALYRAGDPEDLENLTDEETLSVIYDAYEEAYRELMDYGFISYIVPADVNFEDVSDGKYFHEQLARWCANHFSESNAIVQSVMSTNASDPIAAMLNPATAAKTQYQIDNCGLDGIWFPEADPYRFLSVAAGRALMYSPRLGISYEYGLGALFAGLSSSLGDDIATTGRKLNNINLKHVPSRSEADALSEHGLIPFGLTVDARRGRSAEITVMSDNNLGMPVSDFQQNQTVRFVRRVSTRLVRAVDPFIGTSGIGIETAIEDVLSSLKKKDLLRSYDWRMARDVKDITKLNVVVDLSPYFATKVISVTTSVGPITQ